MGEYMIRRLKRGDLEIDQRIRRLVEVLNRVPGVSTTESCGGHPEPRTSGVPENEFYVCFQIWHSRLARRALTFISAAAFHAKLMTEDPGGIADAEATIEVITAFDDLDTIPRVDSLAYKLKGKHVLPDLLAEYIERIAKEGRRLCPGILGAELGEKYFGSEVIDARLERRFGAEFVAKYLKKREG